MLRSSEILTVLTALLEDSAAAWSREENLVRFRLKREGILWETACRCLDGRLLIYGRCPIPIRDRDGFWAECSRINSQVVEGALFLGPEGLPVFRIGIQLDELCLARAQIARALEYNAAVIARFWGPMSRFQ